MPSLQRTNTILFEIQQACIQLSLTRPTDAFVLTDQNLLMMTSAANLAGIMVNDAHAWQSQRKQVTFTGDDTTVQFDFPTDFDRFVDGTGWSSSFTQPVIPLNPQQWATAIAWTGGSFYINPACRIWQNKLEFLTAPALDNEITFEYISSNWVIDADDPATFKGVVEKNGDTPMFDWLLMVLAIKAKWLELKRMDTASVMSDFNDRLQQLMQNDVLGATLTLNGPSGMRYLDYYNVPQTGYGS